MTILEKYKYARRLFDTAAVALGMLPLQADKLTVTTTIDQSATTVATPVVLVVIAPTNINASSIGSPLVVVIIKPSATIDQHATTVATPKVVPVIAPAATLDVHATTVPTPLLVAVLVVNANIDQHATTVPTPGVEVVIAPAINLDYHATVVPAPSVEAVIAPTNINASSIRTPLVVPVLLVSTTIDNSSIRTPVVEPIIAPAATLDYHATVVPTPLVVAVIAPTSINRAASTTAPSVVVLIAPPATINNSAIFTPSLVVLVAPPATLDNYFLGTPTVVPLIIVSTPIDQTATVISAPHVFPIVSSGVVIICATVAVEGGNEPPTFTFGASSSLDMTGDVDEHPILSIRPRLLYNNITNRALIVPLKLFVACEGGTTTWRLIANPTSLDSPSFVNADPQSHVEVDKVALSVTGGHELAAGFLAPAANKEQVDLSTIFTRLGRLLRLDAFGTIQDTITLSMKNSDPMAKMTCRASILWGEIR